MFVSSSFNTYVNLPKKKKLICSNFPLFSFLRQKPINVFLNYCFFFFFLFFYATDIFWTVIELKKIIFFLDMLQNQEEEEIGY